MRSSLSAEYLLRLCFCTDCELVVVAWLVKSDRTLLYTDDFLSWFVQKDRMAGTHPATMATLASTKLCGGQKR